MFNYYYILCNYLHMINKMIDLVLFCDNVGFPCAKSPINCNLLYVCVQVSLVLFNFDVKNISC